MSSSRSQLSPSSIVDTGSCAIKTEPIDDNNISMTDAFDPMAVQQDPRLLCSQTQQPNQKPAHERADHGQASERRICDRRGGRFKGPVYTLSVGEAQKEFVAPGHVLRTSPFFDRFLQPGTGEFETRKIYLPDDDEDIFGLLLEYLYTCEFFPLLGSVNNRALSQSWRAGQIPDLANLFCAAERHSLSSLQSLILAKLSLLEPLPDKPFLDFFRIIYAALFPVPRMAVAYLEQSGNHIRSAIQETWFQDYMLEGGNFARDLTRFMAVMISNYHMGIASENTVPTGNFGQLILAGQHPQNSLAVQQFQTGSPSQSSTSATTRPPVVRLPPRFYLHQRVWARQSFDGKLYPGNITSVQTGSSDGRPRYSVKWDKWANSETMPECHILPISSGGTKRKAEDQGSVTRQAPLANVTNRSSTHFLSASPREEGRLGFNLP